jgi:ActR/RegA family two-component response regulator
MTHEGILTASTGLPIESVLLPRSRSNNVLVVDDDNALCLMIQRMLSCEQYQVQISKSVADALRVIE